MHNKEEMEMAEPVCPECGCGIKDEAFEKGGVLYCCEPCATSCDCECGCLDESKAKPSGRLSPKKGPRRGSN
jgi:hypothetical protein